MRRTYHRRSPPCCTARPPHPPSPPLPPRPFSRHFTPSAGPPSDFGGLARLSVVLRRQCGTLGGGLPGVDGRFDRQVALVPFSRLQELTRSHSAVSWSAESTLVKPEPLIRYVAPVPQPACCAGTPHPRGATRIRQLPALLSSLSPALRSAMNKVLGPRGGGDGAPSSAAAHVLLGCFPSTDDRRLATARSRLLFRRIQILSFRFGGLRRNSSETMSRLASFTCLPHAPCTSSIPSSSRMRIDKRRPNSAGGPAHGLTGY